MKKSSKFLSSPVRLIVVGAILLLLSGFIIGLGGVTHLIPSGHATLHGTDITYGVRSCIKHYFLIWKGDIPTSSAMYCIVMVLLAFLGLLIKIIIFRKTEKVSALVAGIGAFLGELFLPFIVLLNAVIYDCGGMSGRGQLMIVVALGLLVLGLLILLYAELVAHKVIRFREAGECCCEECECHKEEPVEEPKEEVKEEPVKEEPVVQEKKPEPVKEEKKPEPVVEEEAEGGITGFDRKSFAEKLELADEELRGRYEEIKAEAELFGLKGRLSNYCDSYHAGRVTYLKVAISGKTIKCFLALNPADYADSPIPAEDVSDKKAYAALPLLIRVKSNLACRRVKKLIADMAEKNGLEKAK